MKKKIIAVATVFVVALVAAYGVYNNQNKNALADLMLDNVEALAQSETSNFDCANHCFITFDRICGYGAWGGCLGIRLINT